MSPSMDGLVEPVRSKTLKPAPLKRRTVTRGQMEDRGGMPLASSASMLYAREAQGPGQRVRPEELDALMLAVLHTHASNNVDLGELPTRVPRQAGVSDATAGSPLRQSATIGRSLRFRESRPHTTMAEGPSRSKSSLPMGTSIRASLIRERLEHNSGGLLMKQMLEPVLRAESTSVGPGEYYSPISYTQGSLLSSGTRHSSAKSSPRAKGKPPPQINLPTAAESETKRSCSPPAEFHRIEAYRPARPPVVARHL
jgi:hypothetical protein